MCKDMFGKCPVLLFSLGWARLSEKVNESVWELYEGASPPEVLLEEGSAVGGKNAYHLMIAILRANAGNIINTTVQDKEASKCRTSTINTVEVQVVKIQFLMNWKECGALCS